MSANGTPQHNTPSRNRSVLGNVTSLASNIGNLISSFTTPTKPVAPVSAADAETPEQNGCWTSADNFKFVEEDDDEVLFRVRDSGVLRSLTLPCLTEETENTGVSIEEKQARVRAMRLSLAGEKSGQTLPPLNEVLEISSLLSTFRAKSLPIAIPKVASAQKEAPESDEPENKPPPMLDESTWEELENEVRRVSVEPLDLADGFDATENTSTEQDPEDGVVTVAKLCEMGFSQEEAEWAVREAAEREATITASAEAPSAEEVAESKPVVEEAVMATLEAKPSDNAPLAVDEELPSSCSEDAVPATIASESAVLEEGAETAELGSELIKCIRRQMSDCVEICAPVSTVVEAQEEIREDASPVDEAALASEQEETTTPEEEVITTEAEPQDLADAYEKVVDPTVPEEVVAVVNLEPIKCIRRQGCKCPDCAETCAPLASAACENEVVEVESEVIAATEPAAEEKVPIQEKVVNEPIVEEVVPSQQEDLVEETESFTPEPAVEEEATTEVSSEPIKCIRRQGCKCPDCAEMCAPVAAAVIEVKPVEEEHDIAFESEPLVEEAPVSIEEDNVTEPLVQEDASSQPKELVEETESCTPEPAVEKEATIALVEVSSEPIKCIRRQGCKCPDCAEMCAPVAAPVLEVKPVEEEHETASESEPLVKDTESEPSLEDTESERLVEDAPVSLTEDNVADPVVQEDASSQPKEPADTTESVPTDLVRGEVTGSAEVCSEPIKCIRRQGCKCPDCAEMCAPVAVAVSSPESAEEQCENVLESGSQEDEQQELVKEEVVTEPLVEEAALSQSEEAVEQTPESVMQEEAAVPAILSSEPIKCIRRQGCNCPDCVEMCAPVAIAVPNPVSAEEEDETPSPVPEPSAEEDLVFATQEDKIVEAVVEETVTVKPEEPTPEPADTTKSVATDLVQEEVTAPAEVSSEPIKCIRRQGCKCPDCVEMCAPIVAAVSQPEPAEKEEIVSDATPSTEPDVSSPSKSSCAVMEQQVAATEAVSYAPVKETVLDDATTTQADVVQETPQNVPVEVSGPVMCTRRQGCVCPDCAEMAAMMKDDTKSPVGEQSSESEPANEVDAHNSTTEEYFSSNESVTDEHADEDTANVVPVPSKETAEENSPKPGNSSFFRENETPEPSQDQATENTSPSKDSAIPQHVSSSPPVPAMSKTTFSDDSSTAVDLLCTRRAGCRCVDCSEMAALCIMPTKSAKTEKYVVEEKNNDVVETEAPKSVQESASESGQDVDSEEAWIPSTPEKTAAPQRVTNSPPVPAVAAQDVPVSGRADVDAVCTRRAGCRCVDCVEMMGMCAPVGKPPAIKRLLSPAGSKSPKSLLSPSQRQSPQRLLSPAVKPLSPAVKPLSPSVASPAVEKSEPLIVEKSVPVDIVVENAVLSRVAANEETKMRKPAPSKYSTPQRLAQQARGMIDSPNGRANAEALRDLMDMDDGNLLDISLMDETDLVGTPASSRSRTTVAPESSDKAPLAASGNLGASNNKMKWEISKDWDELKTDDLASSQAVSTVGRKMYTLEDFERIAAFRIDEIEARHEKEKIRINLAFDTYKAEASATQTKLITENTKLKGANREAEKTVDAMANVIETERKQAGKTSKELADMKGYADELETAFNELHERYITLKDYFQAMEKEKNETQEHLSHSNALLKQSQEQISSLELRYKNQEGVHQKDIQQREDTSRQREAKTDAELAEIKAKANLLQEQFNVVQKELAEKESALVQSNVRAQLGQQEAVELRKKSEEWKVACATTQQQLKNKTAALAELETSSRSLSAVAEEQRAKDLHELQTLRAWHADVEKTPQGMLRQQVKLFEIQTGTLKGQVEAKEKENQQLKDMCDELMKLLEESKAALK